MNEMIKRGILCKLPVVNEILLCVVLLSEVIDRIKDWRKKKQESSSTKTEAKEAPNDDEQ